MSDADALMQQADTVEKRIKLLDRFIRDMRDRRRKWLTALDQGTKEEERGSVNDTVSEIHRLAREGKTVVKAIDVELRDLSRKADKAEAKDVSRRVDSMKSRLREVDSGFDKMLDIDGKTLLEGKSDAIRRSFTWMPSFLGIGGLVANLISMGLTAITAARNRAKERKKLEEAEQKK